MTQTTYSAIEIEGKHWLAKEPVMEKPDPRRYHFAEDNQAYLNLLWKYEQSLQGSIEIPKEHEKEFEGRTGLEKGIHFTEQKQWLREKSNEWVDLDESRAYNALHKIRTVAIPIKTDRGEDEIWEELYQMLVFSSNKKSERMEKCKQSFIIIKRKQ